MRMRNLRQICHPHHLILIVPGLPFVVLLLLVLLLLLMLLLLLLLQLQLLLCLLLLKVLSSIVRGVLHLLLPPQAVLLLKKMRCKEVSNFILEKWYENEMLPHLSVSGSMNPPMMGLCVSSSLLGVYWQYYNPEKGCPSTMPCYYSFLQRASS
jgi:hypothetical protein